MQCLALLFHKGLASPTELAAYTGLSSGATTAMLDRRERAKLIRREANPADRRGTLIRIDRTGTDKAAPWFDSVRKVQAELVSSYSLEELRLIADFFEKSVQMWEAERRKLLGK
jgi:DNA-binding MarR family transcriptional regulator